MTGFAAILGSALAMTLIVGVRYLVTSGAFAWATRHRHPGLYAGLEPQMRREIFWSLASAAIYGVPAGIVAWGWQQRGWTQIYTDIHAYPLWYLPVSLFICLLAHDSWFYWTHRWMHAPWLFRIAHAVHHESRPPTAWAAMSFHPWEAISGAVVVPILVFVLPLHIGTVAALLTIMTIMGVGNHMGWEMFPRWLVHGRFGNWIITATHHQKHHQAYRGNYGLYFRIWDRLCGTDLGLGSFAHAASGSRPQSADKR
jgi:lathosterol oxidase